MVWKSMKVLMSWDLILKRSETCAQQERLREISMGTTEWLELFFWSAWFSDVWQEWRNRHCWRNSQVGVSLRKWRPADHTYRVQFIIPAPWRRVGDFSFAGKDATSEFDMVHLPDVNRRYASDAVIGDTGSVSVDPNRRRFCCCANCRVCRWRVTGERLRILLRLSVLDRASPRPASSQTETASLLEPKASVVRKCCSSPKAYELPNGNIITVGTKTLPLRGNSVPVQDLQASRRKHHHCWYQKASVARRCCSSSVADELRDGHIIVVGAKRFRCAEVLVQPKGPRESMQREICTSFLGPEISTATDT